MFFDEHSLEIIRVVDEAARLGVATLEDRDAPRNPDDVAALWELSKRNGRLIRRLQGEDAG
jgi:hypothetical protein